MLNAFVLIGNKLERTSIIDKIKEAMGKYDLIIFDNTYSWEYVSQFLSEKTCFGENKLILINELPTIKNKDNSAARTKILNDLKKILPEISGNICVVLNGIDITSKVFFDAIKDKVQIKIFDNMVPKQGASNNAVNRFISCLEKKDKTIDIEDAILAIDSLNFNSDKVLLDDVFLLVNKIEHVMGSRKKIAHADIMAVCSDTPDFLIWNLLNALDNRDIKNALLLIETLYSKSFAIEHETVMAITTLIWKFRLLLFVKSCLKNKMSTDVIWQKLEKMTKLESKGHGFQRISFPQQNKTNKENTPLYSKNVFYMLFNNYKNKALQNYSIEQLQDILQLLENSLIKIRSGCTEGEIVNIMELSCIVICNMLPYQKVIPILKSNYIL